MTSSMRHLLSGLVVAVVLMAAATSAPGASHWPGGLGKHHGKFWKREKVREKLQLSDDEVRDLERIFASHQQTFIDLEADVKKKRADLDTLLSDDQTDDARVMTQVDLLERARANLGKARVMMLLELRKILTPAQREALAHLKEDHERDRPGAEDK